MKEGATCQIVAIVGGSGSGKTWLADRLQLLLGELAGRLALDNFYLDRSHLAPSRREDLNFDRPESIDWRAFDRVLAGFAAGRPVRVPSYDFRTHCRGHAGVPVAPHPVLLVDGLWLLARPELRNRFHLSIYVDCPETIRLRRRLARDLAERGRSAAAVRRQFRDRVTPMHERHVAPQERWAQVVMRVPFGDPDVRRLYEAVWSLLHGGSLLPAWMRETFRAELTALLANQET